MSIPQMSLDSGSILPNSEPGFTHPDDVAAMQAIWAQVCEEDEYLKAHQWSSAASQHVQNNQRSFPTLNQFTAPVAGLPQFPPTDPSQYYSSQPSAVPQTLEGPAWSQPAHDSGSSANGPDFSQDHFPTIVDLELWAAGDPRAYGPRRLFSQEQNTDFQMGMSIPSATEHTGYATIANTFLPSASDSDAAMDLSDGSSLEPSSSASNGTVCAKRPKRRRTIACEDTSLGSTRVLRKRKTPPTVESEDTSSGSTRVLRKRKTPPTVESEDTSLGSTRVLRKRKTPPTVDSEDTSSGSFLPQRKRRCLDDSEDEIKEGKFGAYTLANASSVVMAMPVHDPKPVDISNRRTHDAFGNPLRTRRFGAMELDDSYSKRSVKIANGLPAEMTVVRACGWGDKPCGLFLEMNKSRVAYHLFLWHGVKLGGKAPCKFEDCSTSAMVNLGRHIEGVHYTTVLECPCCGKRISRSDSLERHHKTCKPFLVCKASAKKGRRQFNPKDPKKLVYGYIVPARNAK